MLTLKSHLQLRVLQMAGSVGLQHVADRHWDDAQGKLRIVQQSAHRDNSDEGDFKPTIDPTEVRHEVLMLLPHLCGEVFATEVLRGGLEHRLPVHGLGPTELRDVRRALEDVYLDHEEKRANCDQNDHFDGLILGGKEYYKGSKDEYKPRGHESTESARRGVADPLQSIVHLLVLPNHIRRVHHAFVGAELQNPSLPDFLSSAGMLSLAINFSISAKQPLMTPRRTRLQMKSSKPTTENGRITKPQNLIPSHPGKYHVTMATRNMLPNKSTLD
mmetsp:Transcript_115104/g.372349  ORF Transcript_115104/g.372349 Transcript_115104/m.372349 type:complete len:273 (-) Transcript_115104:551-1369(-)